MTTQRRYTPINCQLLVVGEGAFFRRIFCRLNVEPPAPMKWLVRRLLYQEAVCKNNWFANLRHPVLHGVFSYDRRLDSPFYGGIRRNQKVFYAQLLGLS